VWRISSWTSPSEIRSPSASGREGNSVTATDEKPISCVGWVANQLGPGNNLALRLRAMRDPEFANVRTVGPQRRRFEDTFDNDGDDA
jgi:hypothetical protein